MTLLFDLIRLCALPRYAYMDGKDAFAESLYCLVFLTKVRARPHAAVRPLCAGRGEGRSLACSASLTHPRRSRAARAAQFGALGLLAVLKRQEMAASQYPDTGDGREPEIAE